MVLEKGYYVECSDEEVEELDPLDHWLKTVLRGQVVLSDQMIGDQIVSNN